MSNIAIVTLVTFVCGGFLCQGTTGQECSLLTSCNQCISRNASCGWCNNKDTFIKVSMDPIRQLLPAALCGTVDELKRFGCPTDSIVNPQGNVTEANDDDIDDTSGSGDDSSQILPVLPSRVSIKLRPGISKNFTVKVQPPSFISVDMYILMDLSFTMYDDLGNLRILAQDLVTQMEALTDEFRIGFGTFVEKPVSPFIDRLSNYSCAPDYNLPGGDRCIPAYSFLHRLNFTDDVATFQARLSESRPSGSIGRPHSMLDALLQVALCENEMGWRDSGSARRLILVLTDDDYHIALDGKLAGLRKQPDGTCRIDPSGLYEYAKEVDYPSSAYVADILNERRIIPIFAVERRTSAVYQQLSEIIRSAFVGELASSSANLLQLISTQYTRLSTTVVPVISGSNQIPELTITAMPIDNCTTGSLMNGTNDTCTGVVFPNTVEYNVTVSLSYDYCLRDYANSTHQIELLYIGFGDVQINITGICSCECASSKVENSSECNGIGTYECSTCICPTLSSGPQCSCPVTPISTAGCLPEGTSNTSLVCSGRGDCNCNECTCNDIPNLMSGRKYQGRFCECDPNSCPTGINENGLVLPCSGHGSCGCDTQCICDPGYSGINCECSNSTDTCRNPAGSNTDILCTDAGSCQCGICVCNDYSIRYGVYCQECGVCARSCSHLDSCVRCHIEGNCDSSCDRIDVVDDILNIPFYNTSNFLFRNCSISRDSCEVIYNVDQYILGTEEQISVYLNTKQFGYTNWQSGCGGGTSIEAWLIPLVITILIIVLAIIALALWKAISYLIEYFEYREWKKSQDTEIWNESTDNPLFITPTTSHINPKYRPKNVNTVQLQQD